MEVSPLIGTRSLTAMRAFHTLMLGMKMLPMNSNKGYEDFFDEFQDLEESEQEKFIRQAALFVELGKDEVEALASFCKDKNGISYQPANIKNLSPDQLIDIIVAVCMKIGQIRITSVTDAEKKKLRISQSISDSTSPNTRTWN
jgi:hypothetical protein